MIQSGVRAAVNAAGIVGQWVTQIQAGPLEAEKGAYLLVVELQASVTLRSARFAGLTLTPGWYVYAGSANGPGGLRARINRHLRATKKIHWHIDQLTEAGRATEALAVPGSKECDLLATLSNHPAFDIAAPGFGSTDCRRCSSHLLSVVSRRQT